MTKSDRIVVGVQLQSALPIDDSVCSSAKRNVEKTGFELSRATMVTLSNVINELLDENIRLRIRCLRSFQLIYWMVNGGTEGLRFRQAAAIYTAAYLGWRSMQYRRQGKTCGEAVRATMSEALFQEILDDCNDSHLFFRLLYLENTIVRIDEEGVKQFERIAEFYENFMRIKRELPSSASFNNASELTGGRTNITKLRKDYEAQAGFIYASMSMDRDYFNLFAKGHAFAKDRTRSLLKGLQGRIEDGRTMRFLQLAKASISILDTELAGTLESAWADLEPAELHLLPLTKYQIDRLHRGPRRSAPERKSTSRLKASPDSGSR